MAVGGLNDFLVVASAVGLLAVGTGGSAIATGTTGVMKWSGGGVSVLAGELGHTVRSSVVFTTKVDDARTPSRTASSVPEGDVNIDTVNEMIVRPTGIASDEVSVVDSGDRAVLTLSGIDKFERVNGVTGRDAGTTAPIRITVVQTSTATGLYPGGSVALSGIFNNLSAGPAYITAVSAAVHAFRAQADGAKPACTQADFSIAGVSNAPGWIAADKSVGAWNGLTLEMTNSGANQDNCKGLDNINIDYMSR